MLKATLDKKVAKPVDHQGISLGDDSFYDFVLLLDGTHFELLLQEDRSLLIVVTDNLVNDVLPVASHASVEEATIIEGLHGRDIGLSRRRWRLQKYQRLSAPRLKNEL